VDKYKSMVFEDGDTTDFVEALVNLISLSYGAVPQ